MTHIKKMTKIERYTAFLLANLPVMAQCNLYPEEKYYRLPFHAVLRKTLEYVKHAKQSCVSNEENFFLEFGVYKGTSINIIAEFFPSRDIFGFDSFEGFPDDGRTDWQENFSVEGFPDAPENVHFIKGFFQDSLPDFLKRKRAKAENSKAIFINVDCDLYSSTKDIFHYLTLYNKIVPGTVIYCDELINYTGYLWNEFLALFEMLENTGFGVKWLYVHRNVRQLEDSLERLENDTFPNWKESGESGFILPASLEITENKIDYGPLHDTIWLTKVKTAARRLERIFTKFGISTNDE